MGSIITSARMVRRFIISLRSPVWRSKFSGSDSRSEGGGGSSGEDGSACAVSAWAENASFWPVVISSKKPSKNSTRSRDVWSNLLSLCNLGSRVGPKSDFRNPDQLNKSKFEIRKQAPH